MPGLNIEYKARIVLRYLFSDMTVLEIYGEYKITSNTLISSMDHQEVKEYAKTRYGIGENLYIALRERKREVSRISKGKKRIRI